MRKMLEVSNIESNNYRQALRFCIYMLTVCGKVCVPVGRQIYFKEEDYEPCDFVFSKYIDYIYG